MRRPAIYYWLCGFSLKRIVAVVPNSLETMHIFLTHKDTPEHANTHTNAYVFESRDSEYHAICYTSIYKTHTEGTGDPAHTLHAAPRGTENHVDCVDVEGKWIEWNEMEPI